MSLPTDQSPASVLLRHMARFMRSPKVNAKEAFDVAWEDAQAQGTSPTDFIVLGLFKTYLESLRGPEGAGTPQ